MRKIILKTLINLIIIVSRKKNDKKVKYIKLYDENNKTLKIFMKVRKEC